MINEITKLITDDLATINNVVQLHPCGAVVIDDKFNQNENVINVHIGFNTFNKTDEEVEDNVKEAIERSVALHRKYFPKSSSVNGRLNLFNS